MHFQSSYFNRDDVAYPGFSKFFAGASDEERDHAKKLIDYMGKRGGRVSFKSIWVRVLEYYLVQDYANIVSFT